ncbi:MAG: acetate kinase [Bacteroidota bacterium]|nr:acetate kinase [Bacteroidota bacterium]
MIVLVLNCGSSSIKYQLFDMNTTTVMAQGGIEKIGLEGSFLKLTMSDGQKVIIDKNIPEHQTGVELILSVLTSKEYGCINSLSEIDAVGHRIVHGGEKFSHSVLITNEVIEMVEQCIDLAPLHNPSNLVGIRAVEKLMPGVPQVGVFDTAFHQTMPPKAYIYGLPYSYYTKYGIRRYGFHGTSHRYVSRRACEILGVPYEHQRIITAHIGNGASITAIRNGKSIDTSMGMTPVDGLLMGTRSGEIDAGVLTFISEKEQLHASEISDLLNKKSGVLGVSGVSSDMRELSEAVKEGNQRAALAMDMYNYRIKKYVGSYAAVLGGLDLLIFTGGVGENQWTTRSEVCANMEFMGIKLDESKNIGLKGKEMVISAPDSKVTVMVVPTNEELMIAKDTIEILSK